MASYRRRLALNSHQNTSLVYSSDWRNFLTKCSPSGLGTTITDGSIKNQYVFTDGFHQDDGEI